MLLDKAGFVDVAVEPIAGARRFTSATIDDDVRTLLEVGPLGESYDTADEGTRQAAIDAVVAALEPYRDDGVWSLPGAARTVTARRP